MDINKYFSTLKLDEEWAIIREVSPKNLPFDVDN